MLKIFSLVVVILSILFITSFFIFAQEGSEGLATSSKAEAIKSGQEKGAKGLAPKKEKKEEEIFFPFKTKLAVVPGDTYVELKWEPFIVENIKLEEEELRKTEPERGKLERERIVIAGPERGKLERERIVIAGYQIFYGEKSGEYTKNIDVGNVTSYKIRNLDNYKTYFFAVRAYTKDKRYSSFSEEITATPKEVKDLLSEIEKGFVEEKIPQEISREIFQFGYDIFKTTVSTFAPVTDVPVGPDYVIGAGDRFTIDIWGRIEASYKVEVDQNGEIIIPKIGRLKVWGLTFSQLRNFLQTEFSNYYKDFHINITMDRIRTIQVFVVGEAETPGSFTISSLATAYNALFAAGGPTKRGTMRKIKLMRNGEVVKEIDLYDFLLKGDKSQDQRLQSGDTLFIPIIGPVAGIAGNIKRPAIYEFKDRITLGELLEMAGGITSTGYLQRIQVERVVAHEKRIVLDLNLAEGEEVEKNPKLDEELQDGDFVKVFPILSLTEKIVYLEGNVQRPGGYELKDGMRVRDLIKSLEDLLPESYLAYASITRELPPDRHIEILSFNVGKLLLEGDESQNLELKSRDKVKIYSKEEMQGIPKVRITGEVANPADYELFKNMRVKDLIFRAGNLLRNAYLPSAELTRITKLEDTISTKQIYIDLREVLKENPEHNIVLEPDDHLSIRSIPEWVLDNTVTLKGEVKFPGVYTIAKGERLSSVIERAGGYTEKAFLKGAFFTRESEKLKIKEKIDEFVSKLEQEVLQESVPEKGPAIAAGGTGSLTEEYLARKEFLNLKTELIKKMKEAKIEGRIVVKLDSLDKFKNSIYDLTLEKGDTLNIPAIPSSVTVLGEVYNPTSVIYRKGVTIGEYLNLVGGPNKNANEDEIYLIRADGTTISRLQGRSWNTAGTGWFTPSFMNIKAEPGDTILVPKKLLVLDYLKYADQITRTLANIATTVAVIFGVLQ